MNIKAIFFDIDGTLVSFKTHKVPQSAIDAIRRVREKGVKVFIATGRPMPFIRNLNGLEVDGIMSVNGASCITADGKVICHRPVPKADIERVIADAQVHPMPIAFTSNDRAIVCNMEADMERFKEVFTLLDIPLPKSTPITEALNMDVMQMVAFFDKDEEPRMMKEVMKECDANRWHPYFADCIAKGTNKATGIDEICNYYGIDISETMAVGDGGNDIAMLRHAGIGVAMGNASDEVKACADMVTETVDEDGVAKLLTAPFLSFGHSSPARGKE